MIRKAFLASVLVLGGSGVGWAGPRGLPASQGSLVFSSGPTSAVHYLEGMLCIVGWYWWSTRFRG